MKVIVSTSHIAMDIRQSGNDFGPKVADIIKKTEDMGLEVEVQYQQGENVFSVLILGRKEI